MLKNKTISCLIAAILAVSLHPLSVLSQQKEWKSGEIISQDTFLYGALETQVKASKGSGAITAFLFIKPDNSQGGWQELAYEFFGKGSGHDLQTQIITPSDVREEGPQGDFRQQHMEQETSSQNFFNEFVTARMEWGPDRLAFYLDGELLREHTSSSDYSTYQKFWDNPDPMEIRVDLWAGFSDWSGQLDPSNPPTDAQFKYISYERYENGEFVPEWRDEFEGNSLDTSRWRKGDHTFDYALTQYAPENVVVSDGLMTLEFTHA